ncbi:YjgN family protein [Phaeovibrio sulfidiphilus]|uniref:YjgN family protein n=1 Tax=Phaeovibrio sulfidiphilus TaxID=1220600 RepID=UPI0030845C77
MEFSGTAREYMGIWIVNLILSVITIGIWTPWAKVRRLRYFYGNTRLADGHFDYLARPVRILAGRAFVVAVLCLYSLAAGVAPVLAGLLFYAMAAGLPWIINRSLVFNARVTVWRNVRFNFRPSFWPAALAYGVFPVLAALSLGLLIPVGSRIAARFYVNRHSLGRAAFVSDPPLRSFYAALGGAVLLGAAVMFAFAFVQALGLFLDGLLSSPNGSQGPAPGVVETGLEDFADPPAEDGAPGPWSVETLAEFLDPVLLVLLVFQIVPAVLLGSLFYRAAVRRLVLNSLVLEGGHRFRSTLSPLRVCWIAATNTLAVGATLGLAAPWAAVRMWRYQCACLSVIPGGPADTFVSENADAGSAFGSEFADIEGLEIGL